MKKWMQVAVVGMLAVSMVSCKGKSQTESSSPAAENSSSAAESQEETSGDETIGEEEMPNPVKEIEGPADFKEIELSMEAPEDATEVAYYIISDEIGEISFELDGVKYSYRGAAHAEDFAGIFEEFEEEESALSDCGADEDLIVKTTVSGGRLASWTKGGVKYTLYTPSAVSDEELFPLCIELIEKN